MSKHNLEIQIYASPLNHLHQSVGQLVPQILPLYQYKIPIPKTGHYWLHRQLLALQDLVFVLQLRHLPHYMFVGIDFLTREELQTVISVLKSFPQPCFFSSYRSSLQRIMFIIYQFIQKRRVDFEFLLLCFCFHFFDNAFITFHKVCLFTTAIWTYSSMFYCLIFLFTRFTKCHGRNCL